MTQKEPHAKVLEAYQVDTDAELADKVERDYPSLARLMREFPW